MNVQLRDLDGTPFAYTNVDRVTFVNHESYGVPGAQEAVEDDDLVALIVNVNNFVTLRLAPDA